MKVLIAALALVTLIATRPSLGPPRGLPTKPSSFSRLINSFVSPDEPTSVTGGDTSLAVV